MAVNAKATVTVASAQVTEISGTINVLQITNVGTNPVTLHFWDWPAVVNTWVVLPFQYATFSYESTGNFLGKVYAIASGGSSDIAIFYF